MINICMYVPLGLFGFAALQQRGRAPRAALIALASGIGLSLCLESLQTFVVTRVPSAIDVICNSAGAALGISAAWILDALRLHFFRQVKASLFGRSSGAVMLAAGWVAYQGFPFYPAISRTQLRLKAGNLMTGPFSLIDAFAFFGEWLAVGALAELLLGRRAAIRTALALCVLVPARFLLEDRTFSWDELVGALAACLWMAVSSAPYQRRLRSAAMVLGAGVAAKGLVPFHLSSSPAAFAWIPFRSFLEWDGVASVVTLLRKSFYYSAMIWLVRDGGGGIVLATVGTAVLLGVVEVLQIWLPGHSPESTDPVMALLLGCCLFLVDRPRTAGAICRP